MKIVEELKVTASGNCSVCRIPAALLLAFCHEVAFGIFRDVDISNEWLRESRAPKSHLSNLLKETSIYDNRSDPSGEEEYFVKGSHMRYRNSYSSSLATQIATEGVARPAIDLLRAEIKGKQEIGIARVSQYTLYDSLASILEKVGAFEEAEYARKQCCIIRRESNWLSRLFEAHVAEADLARVLHAQGRGNEAISVLKTGFPFLLRNPNGKHPFWLLRRKPWNRDPGMRLLLVKFLLESERLDEVLSMDLGFDTRDSSDMFANDHANVRANLVFMGKLGEALLARGRVDDAVKLHRDRRRLHVKLSGSGSRAAIIAQHDLAFALSHKGSEEVDESIALHSAVLDAQAKTDNLDLAVETRYALAFSLAKKGQTANAIRTMRSALTTWIEAGMIESQQAMGCTVKLGSCLCVDNESDLSMAVRFQTELLIQCEKEGHAGIQLAIIKLVLALSRPEGMDQAIQLSRTLLDLQTRYASSDSGAILRTQVYLTSLLSHQGFAVQNSVLLDEAMTVSETIKRTVEHVFDARDVETVNAIRLSASVYSKKACHLYILYGFGERDKPFLNKTIEVHRQALRVSEVALGWNDIATLSSATALANNLSDHGLHMGLKNEMVEAKDLLSTVLKTILRIEGAENIATKRIQARIDRLRHRYGEISDEDAALIQEEFLDCLLSKLGGWYHPQVVDQMSHLATLWTTVGRTTEARVLAHEVVKRCVLQYGYHLPQTQDAMIVVGWMTWQMYPFTTLPYCSHAVRLAEQLPNGRGYHPRSQHYRFMNLEGLDILFPLEERTVREAEMLLRVQISHFPEAHSRTIRTINRMTNFYVRRDRKELALSWLKESLRQNVILFGMSESQNEWLKLQKAIARPQNELYETQELLEQSIITLRAKGKGVAGTQNDAREVLTQQASTLCLSARILGCDHIFTQKQEESLSLRLHEEHVANVEEVLQQVISLGRTGHSPKRPEQLRS